MSPEKRIYGEKRSVIRRKHKESKAGNTMSECGIASNGIEEVDQVEEIAELREKLNAANLRLSIAQKMYEALTIYEEEDRLGSPNHAEVLYGDSEYGELIDVTKLIKAWEDSKI